MGWPAEYGGGGKDLVYQMIFAEEIEYHRAPSLEPAIGYIPQVLLDHGTEEQKLFFLPRLRRGELAVFLGYSEPEAGSDLANIKTVAVEGTDGYVITGQKVYSSYADISDYGFVVARTDPSSVRHRGLSLFLVDMRSPGINLSSYRTVAGTDHHSVHFDHVVVPKTGLVGQLHQGWRVLMGAIDFERATIASPGLLDRQLDRLIAHSLTSDEAGTRPIIEDPVATDRLVTLAVEMEAARLYAYHVADLQARGERPQHETSLAVLLKREAARLADVAAVELLGPYAQLRGDTPLAPFQGAVEHEYREHLFFSFAAGGFDITRAVIATRGLGLPR